MLKICLGFWKSEPQYAYKRYAYRKKMYYQYCIEWSLKRNVVYLVVVINVNQSKERV